MEFLIAVDQRLAGVEGMEPAARPPRPSNATYRTRTEQQQAFDTRGFLDSANTVRRGVEYESKATVFVQGDPATSVLYIHNGGVKLTVVNEVGKEAVVAMLGHGDFLGEGCLAGQSLRINTAATITPSTILAIEKQEMIRLLHAERALSDQFIKHMLSRNIRVEEDLIDQLFNHCEKRLARTLLLLAGYGKQNKPEQTVPEISQETLAGIIGTTRSRVNFFMTKFRDLGFIEYGGRLRGLHINKSLLSVVLKD
jgi:CRP/FNR family transcriptional regulator, cyclic AMP receptor protein